VTRNPQDALHIGQAWVVDLNMILVEGRADLVMFEFTVVGRQLPPESVSRIFRVEREETTPAMLPLHDDDD
jgi:hypothetical protein